MVKASVSGAVDLSLISSQVKPKTSKMAFLVFTASLLDLLTLSIKGTVWEQAC